MNNKNINNEANVTIRDILWQDHYNLFLFAGLAFSKQDEMRMIVQYLTLSTGEP